ncbi:MAG: hypothetical protein COA85_03510 [Robiginitomaculum sp.]|nr:MAG: hypothetical protein COA85_03510 [Robiginitomaculum sp.]
MTITPDDLRFMAFSMVDRHGDNAVLLAGQAVDEMRALGDKRRTIAWLALRSVIEDALDGRIDREQHLSMH